MGAHSRPGPLRRVFRRNKSGGAAAGSALLADDLTGLGSRIAMKSALDDLIASGRSAVLALIDLDGFSGFNRQHGRPAGDEVLKETARVIGRSVEGRGRAFRSGGDAFTVVLQPAPDQTATAWAEQVITDLQPTAASVAVVPVGQQARADRILRDAELTMTALKQAGGGRVGTYGPLVDDWDRHRRSQLDDLAQEVESLRLENQQLLQGTLLDPDTGLPNAAAFDADHLQLDARRRRNQDPYAVLLIEIDHLADFTRTSGIEAARERFREVAATVAETVRQGDRSYRVGAEELAVLLPGAALREAVAAAERVRLKVERLGSSPAGPAADRASLTIAAVAAGFRHEKPKDVIAELERLMASGRAAGGARVVWPY